MILCAHEETFRVILVMYHAAGFLIGGSSVKMSAVRTFFGTLSQVRIVHGLIVNGSWCHGTLQM